MEIFTGPDGQGLRRRSHCFAQRALSHGVALACAEVNVIGGIVAQTKKFGDFSVDDREQKEDHKQARRFLHLPFMFSIITIDIWSRISCNPAAKLSAPHERQEQFA
jgi:hypothetical protein